MPSIVGKDSNALMLVRTVMQVMQVRIVLLVRIVIVMQ